MSLFLEERFFIPVNPDRCHQCAPCILSTAKLLFKKIPPKHRHNALPIYRKSMVYLHVIAHKTKKKIKISSED